MTKLLTSLLIAVLVPAGAAAYVASSTNYRIELDSLNVGGLLATSTNYRIEDTVGESATGIGTSTSYNLYAGYQQFDATPTTITISAPADVTLTPAISEGEGGTANGSAAWTVITNNSAGYNLTIKADSSPALASSGDSFADYSPAGAAPGFTFSVGDSESAFAYSPEGTDLVDNFKDNGSACNTGSSDATNACWEGLSTSDTAIAQAVSANSPGGTETTVKFRAVAGASKSQSAGSYQATITVTATAL
jgi:hypothetical protein